MGLTNPYTRARRLAANSTAFLLSPVSNFNLNLEFYANNPEIQSLYVIFTLKILPLFNWSSESYFSVQKYFIVMYCHCDQLRKVPTEKVG